VFINPISPTDDLNLEPWMGPVQSAREFNRTGGYLIEERCPCVARIDPGGLWVYKPQTQHMEAGKEWDA